MHGFLEKTDFNLLLGKEICQVAIGSYDVQFNWGNGGTATHEFKYTPSDSGKELVWRAELGDPDVAARTVRVLKATIVEVSVTPSALVITFSNGDKLDFIDSEQYESLTISNGEDPLIVV